MDEDSEGGFISSIIMIYFISTQVMSLYFWIEKFQEYNLIGALTIGVIESEFKGIFWPFFI